MSDLKKTLDQKHPVYVAQVHRWLRYRAFTGGLETEEQKRPWLPQGEYESQRAYTQRLALTQSLGYSGPAINRISGALTRSAPNRQYVGQYADELAAFDAQADGASKTVDKLLGEALGEALTMGIAFLVVDKPRLAEPAPSRAAEPLPFAEVWTAEEALNWNVDRAGRLEWIVLKRSIIEQAGPLATAQAVRVWRILDRVGGREYRLSVEDEKNGRDPVLTVEWEHRLGLVPVVPFYAHQLGHMHGRSYIDEISRADLRKLSFDSDQAFASYLHGSPQLVLKVNQDLEEIAADASHIIKLPADADSDAKYLALDATGMDIRENLIDSAIRQGFNLAGIDPNSVLQSGGGSSRSGVSMAWSFSTAEQPTLSRLTDNLDSADRHLHEVVTRYVSPAEYAPDARAFEGSIIRTKSFDMMAVDRIADVGDAVYDRVKSPTWRKTWAGYVASQLPGNLDTATQQTIQTELAAADYDEDADPNGHNGNDNDVLGSI